MNFDQFILDSINGYAYIHMRKTITEEELISAQKKYVGYQKDPVRNVELIDAYEKLFEKIDLGKILIRETI